MTQRIIGSAVDSSGGNQHLPSDIKLRSSRFTNDAATNKIGNITKKRHSIRSEKGTQADVLGVKEIIKKIRLMKGSDPIESDLKLLNKSVNRKMLEMTVRNKYISDTTNQVQSLSDYNPRLLKWLFNEQQESQEEENAWQRNAISDFETRKLDHKYFQMIESKERSNFNKLV